MKPYFHKAEHFTPNPDYNVDATVRLIWKYDLEENNS